jgi:hypothetical protein
VDCSLKVLEFMLSKKRPQVAGIAAAVTNRTTLSFFFLLLTLVDVCAQLALRS